MINFRFHLISLVAVFLALGIGVAMGASFIDRATVDSLRGRVDALEENYRRRGTELDAARRQLSSMDQQTEALAGEGSMALANRVADVPIVVISTEAVPGDVVAATRSSFDASGAQVSGLIRLRGTLGAPRKAELSAARERLGIRGDAGAVSSRIAGDLGSALGLLAVAPTGAGVPTTTTSTAPGSGSSPVPPPTDPAGARQYLTTLVDMGMLEIRDGDVTPEGTFPDGTGYRYVVLVGSGEDPGTVVEPLVTALGAHAPLSTVVAEARAPRSGGDIPTTTEGQPPRGATLAGIRQGDVSADVSTVDDIEEDLGRIATVYAVVEQRDYGRVGHYGTGVGATAPFPTVPTR